MFQVEPRAQVEIQPILNSPPNPQQPSAILPQSKKNSVAVAEPQPPRSNQLQQNIASDLASVSAPTPQGNGPKPAAVRQSIMSRIYGSFPYEPSLVKEHVYYE